MLSHHYFSRRVGLSSSRRGRRPENSGRNTGSETGSQASLGSETSTSKYKGKSNLCCGRGRAMETIQMIVLPLIPIVLLVGQNINSLIDTLSYQNSVKDVDRQVEMTLSMGTFCTAIQSERAQVSFFVFTNTTYNSSKLSDQFDQTDRALELIQIWPPASSIPDPERIFESKSRFEVRLDDFRKKISMEDSNIAEVLEYYTKINHHMLEYLTREIKETNSSSVWKYLVAYKNILRSIENVGISIVYGINYFGRGFLSATNYIKYIRHDTLGLEYLNASMEFASSVREYYEDIQLQPNIQMTRLKILLNHRQEPNIEESIRYYTLMTSYRNSLRQLQLLLRKRIRMAVEERVKDADTQVILTVGLVLLVLVLSPIIIFLVTRATTTIQLYAKNLLHKADQLKREKKKSDRLLFQMLPPSVAQELKQKRTVQAQVYEYVTVYFSDIVSFTEIAADCNPLEVVTFLNSIYKLFDARIERYDVYKVETIGDSYMVASGLPVPNGKICCSHVSEVATMALDLLAGSVIFQVPRRPGEKLQIRIGIHTGSVVAGVVGTKMPRYCLFGDTVNTASRMETTGEPLRIHISMEMKLALDVIGGFRIEHRGLIEVKGKGLMDTYWLSGKDGGIGRSVELDTPSFFDNSHLPAYLADLDDE